MQKCCIRVKNDYKNMNREACIKSTNVVDALLVFGTVGRTASLQGHMKQVSCLFGCMRGAQSGAGMLSGNLAAAPGGTVLAAMDARKTVLMA